MDTYTQTPSRVYTALAAAAGLLLLGAGPAQGGAVTGVENCGGKGRPLELRVSGNDGGTTTLRLHQSYTVDADFVPAATAEKARFRLTAETPFGELPLGDTATGALRAGTKHTARGSFRAGSELVGRTVKIRATVDTGAHRELCLKFTARGVG
ncbi:hypothetical protein [Streptomyces sp. CC210A]|uniref:hypothetical protein n=1 Tax=Streptomyces sp. CC210A TaxID=2898184 RepID=UPI001F321D0A|nr:hypothetical protein [Streptomyces sp. CC210A]